MAPTSIHPSVPAGNAGESKSNEETRAAFESALIAASEAYRRWLNAAMLTAGQGGMSNLEITFLLDLGAAGTHLSFARLCDAARIEEQHLAHYALRKMREVDLVSSRRHGKEKVVFLTDKGVQLYERFNALRRRVLEGIEPDNQPQTNWDNVTAALKQVANDYERARQAALQW